MKRLAILRHAKAVAKTADDFGRVLAPRGRRQMEAVGRHLAAAGPAPDLALVSPAARTRETWALCGLGRTPVRFVEEIYDAECDDLLRVVRGIGDEVGSAVLVGHNPGLEELAAALVRDAGAVRDGLPTAALVAIELPVASWREVTPRQGRIARFETPATLGDARDA